MNKLQEEIQKSKKLMGLVEGLNLPKRQDDLIDAVIDQIEEDLFNKDISAIDELLTFVPKENLLAYLPEEEWGKYRNWDVKHRQEHPRSLQ